MSESVAGRHPKLLRTAKLAALCMHERQVAELRVAVEMCARLARKESAPRTADRVAHTVPVRHYSDAVAVPAS